ncbi:hypothetical protein [Streptomyces sp. Da 82-17]|uniref:hypothetical protein n=1 Tax=Streptomyces sp. Da 82-17 TaxID=3377116 RepID=UPI0038D50141
MSRSIPHEIQALKRQVDQIKKGQRIAHGASIENAAVEVRDDTGSLRTIVGLQADGTSGVNVVNGPTPPAPSLPVVESALAALTVTWDGTFADAQVAPLDWRRVEVHVGPTADYVPEQGTLRDTIETAQGGTVTVPLPYTEWHVKLRSRSASGAVSAATPAVAGTPRKAEAADITAGAITADAIAVDALTGKTITGGSITGALIQTAAPGAGARITMNEGDTNKILVYDSAGTAVGELSDIGLALRGSSGAILQLDPDATYPALKLSNAARTEFAFINVVEDPSGSVNLMLNTSPYTASGNTDMRWRQYMGNDFAVIERFRDSTSGVIGGRLDLRAAVAALGYYDYTGATTFADFALTPNLGKVRGRLNVKPNAGDANTVVLVESAAGHTGYLMRLYNTDAGTYRLTVDLAGNTTVGGVLKAGNIATGSVSITPSAANTPTSFTLSGLNVAGTTFHGFVTANTTVPAPSTGSGGTPNGVNSVSISSVSGSGATIWVNRQNTTNTTVNWMIVGS